MTTIKKHLYTGPWTEETYNEDDELVITSYCPCCEEVVEADRETCCEAAYAFMGAEDQLGDGGITFYQRRVIDGYNLIQNDTLLVLSQQQLSLKGFNARIRKIYEADHPGRTVRGWLFSFVFESNGPFDGMGCISTHTALASAVAEALANLAEELDAGKYSISTSIM
jgi:hypothetical protein